MSASRPSRDSITGVSRRYRIVRRRDRPRTDRRRQRRGRLAGASLLAIAGTIMTATALLASFAGGTPIA